MIRMSKEQREEILGLYLKDPQAGTKLAMDHGLTAAYAYKLANARGLLPLTRHVPRSGLRDAVHTSDELQVVA